MALRVPPRRRPARVTLPEALNRICSEMLSPETERPTPLMGLDAVIAADARREADRRQRDSLAAEIAGILLEAIEDDRLKVEGVPPFELVVWRSRIGLDWQTGRFTLAGPEIPITLKQYYTPTVNLEEAVALFEEPAAAPDKTAPVSAEALHNFVHDRMTAEQMAEGAMKDRAREHFAPKFFTDAQWRTAWSDAPNKLGRGRKAPPKSGT